jgi:biotin carboxyl carrier protein
MSFEIRSTMPGRIVQLSKKAGDKVLEGEEVLVMEAMKMEMPIFAPADGVIAAIKVGEGQAVAKDEILVIVE